tara:strand:- start:52380 stop:53858 length:1479 start_codon:yes stop_codon:yes gene_type:complete
MTVVMAMALLFAGSGTHTPPVMAADRPGLLSAFSILAENAEQSTVVYARVILEGVDQPCPAFVTYPGDKSLRVRSRSNPDSTLFPITVCEARAPFGQAISVVGFGVTIAAASRDPAKVLVYGDSGCDGGAYQDCSNHSAWPFALLSNQGVHDQPDLILHMGDYNYRGTPGQIRINGETQLVYDAGDQDPNNPNCSLEKPYCSMNARGSDAPDQWNNWWLDFFAPAANLLPRAPWIFARGNHELCSRAGPGWFYLLDTGSNLPGAAYRQRKCLHQNDPTPPNDSGLKQLSTVSPYVVDLGSLRIAVIDSANACDNFSPQKTTDEYSRQFSSLRDHLSGTAASWVLTHRPIWGVTSGSGSINQTLQTALAASTAGRLPDSVKLTLAGHMHRYESLTFAEGVHRPPQIVIGNSGVALADDKPGPCIGETRADNAPACGAIEAGFGYLTLSPGNGEDWRAWEGVVAGLDRANSIATCDSSNNPVCSLAKRRCECQP